MSTAEMRVCCGFIYSFIYLSVCFLAVVMFLFSGSARAELWRPSFTEMLEIFYTQQNLNASSLKLRKACWIKSLSNHQLTLQWTPKKLHLQCGSLAQSHYGPARPGSNI